MGFRKPLLKGFGSGDAPGARHPDYEPARRRPPGAFAGASAERHIWQARAASQLRSHQRRRGSSAKGSDVFQVRHDEPPQRPRRVCWVRCVTRVQHNAYYLHLQSFAHLYMIFCYIPWYDILLDVHWRLSHCMTVQSIQAMPLHETISNLLTLSMNRHVLSLNAANVFSSIRSRHEL